MSVTKKVITRSDIAGFFAAKKLKDAKLKEEADQQISHVTSLAIAKPFPKYYY